MQPIRDNILIKSFESDNISDGGIIVPDSVKERSNKAKIIACGNGVSGKPMKLKVGETVFHVKGAGMEVIIDDEKYYLIKDFDCLAIKTD